MRTLLSSPIIIVVIVAAAMLAVLVAATLLGGQPASSPAIRAPDAAGWREENQLEVAPNDAAQAVAEPRHVNATEIRDSAVPPHPDSPVA